MKPKLTGMVQCVISLRMHDIGSLTFDP